MRSVVLCALLAPALVFAQVPAKLGYQGLLLKADGQPEVGVVAVTFSVYSAATGGTPLWSEPQQIALTNGFYATFLGDVTPIPSSAFSGPERFLELSIGGSALTPRQRVGSVAYALMATDARNVVGGTVDASSVKVAGTTVIDGTGKLVGPAAYAAGSGLSLAGNSFSLLSSCASGQVLQWNGTDWACATVGGSNYTPGPGLVLNGDQFSMMPCAAGQVLQHDGSTWACATPPSPAAYSASLNGGLTLLTGNQFSLLTSCTSGQALAWNGTSWGCSTPTTGGVTGSGAAGEMTYWTGAGTIGGNASFVWDNAYQRLGVGTNAPQATASVTGQASFTGAGLVSASSSVSSTTLSGAGTAFLTEIGSGTAPAGTVVTTTGTCTGTGQTRLVTNVTGANALTVDNPWTTDIVNCNYTVGRLVTQLQSATGAPALTSLANGRVGIGTATPQAPLDVSGAANVSGQLIRAIARTQGYISDSTDNGLLTGRSLSFAKQLGSTGLRVTWSDNFRVTVNNNACRWEVLFNGASCTNPGALVFDKYEGNTSSNRHDPNTVVATCFGRAAGSVTITTRVGPVPGYTGPDCHTGWASGLFSIEVEEVY